MAAKRVLHQDPEYEAIPAEVQEKRIKLMEDNVRKQTKKKIENIIRGNFIQEINSKGLEIDALDEQLFECRTTCDRLRACAVTKYYATVGQDQQQPPTETNIPSVHPAVKKYLGKYPRDYNCDPVVQPSTSNASTNEMLVNSSDVFLKVSSNTSSCPPVNANKKIETQSQGLSPSKDISTRAPRFKTKCKIVIGNISKFIPVWQRDESDQSTHKWMVYVRGDKDNPNIEYFVKKVRFLLHPSYRPTDIVEIYNPPFHLVKRGWGEFPVRVQLHFHDPRNKPVDIIHNLKLDKTYTGLQTLGAETVVELQLFKTNASGSKLCVASNMSPLLSLSSNSILHENQESYNESISNSSVTIKVEPDLDSEASIEVSNTDKTTAQSSISAQNSLLNEIHSKENGSEIVSAISENENSSSSLSNSLNKTHDPKSLIPNTSLCNDSSVVNKPIKASTPNGVNTTYLKCIDTDGKVLLVPHTQLLCIKAQKLPANKSTSNTKDNSSQNADKSDKLVNSKTTVPSYILKVVPNQDSGQKQVLLIPMSEKEVQSTNNNQTVKTEENCTKPNNLFGNNHTLSTLDTIAKKLKPGSDWEQELSDIKIEYYTSFVELLRRVCKVYPLVKEGVDRSIYPFCASSLEEYLRWNIGKQRASEWRRAGVVRTTVLNLLKKHQPKYLTVDDVWSRSAIMSWCRKNGCVPMTTEKMTLLPEPKWSGIELCSITNAEELVSTLKSEDSKLNSLEEEEEIEILQVPEDKISAIKANQNQPSHLHLPPSSEACLYVKEIASQIGIEIKPVELEPSVSAPVVEEIILAACREFVTNIIQSSVSQGYSRVGGQFCPEEITVSDVYSAIKDTPQFDFLTNSYLGVPKEARGDT